MNTLTELPEKWFIIWENEKNFQVIKDYFKSDWVYQNDDLHSNSGQTCNNTYIHSDIKHQAKLIKMGYVKITFEEFKKFVLNEPEDYTYLINLLNKWKIY